jgi:hypothetical protein
MKFVASLLHRFSAKGADEQVDIFDKRLTKMIAPAPAARNRRARSIQAPSAFRSGRAALAH